MGTTAPLQIKLITQLLMVSIRNTSRSNVNPLRMQDPPGNADGRPPGTLEAMQANMREVEALRLTNQCLIGELEQLTRQMQHGSHDRPEKVTTFPHMRVNTISTFPKVLKQKQSPAEPRGTDHNWPLGRRARRTCRERRTTSPSARSRRAIMGTEVQEPPIRPQRPKPCSSL